jgi:HSP20 family protein
MANLTRYAPRRSSSALSRFGSDFIPPFDTPFGTIQRLQEDMSQLVDGLLQRTTDIPVWQTTDIPVWQPAVDLYEEGNQWVVKADIPGVEPDDIDLQVTADGLKIAAETTSEQHSEDRGYYRTERRFGSLRRFIPLPAEVDPEQVNANFRNGVLEVRLPKSEHSTRRIPVQASEGNGRTVRAGRG